ncbi:hypothetical protein ILYODFUR_034895, partial [Ilyodon furcidens]
MYWCCHDKDSKTKIKYTHFSISIVEKEGITTSLFMALCMSQRAQSTSYNDDVREEHMSAKKYCNSLHRLNLLFHRPNHIQHSVNFLIKKTNKLVLHPNEHMNLARFNFVVVLVLVLFRFIRDPVAGAADSVETPRRPSPQTPPPAPPGGAQG